MTRSYQRISEIFSFEFADNELLPFIRTSFKADVASVGGFRDVLATNLSTYIDEAIKSVTEGEISNEESLFETTRILGYPRFHSKRIESLCKLNKIRKILNHSMIKLRAIRI